MTSTTSQHRRTYSLSRRTIWTAAGVVALLVFAVLVVGGYALHWRWTGLSGSVTLWDWLEVLALPVAIATAPLLLRHRHGLSRRHHATISGVLIAFGALVLAGYLVPWRWTGFRGNTLWDWLQLVPMRGKAHNYDAATLGTRIGQRIASKGLPHDTLPAGGR